MGRKYEDEPSRYLEAWSASALQQANQPDQGFRQEWLDEKEELDAELRLRGDR